MQGLQPFEDEPGVEDAERGASVADEGLQHFVHPLLRAQHRAAEHAALAVEMLGHGIDHDIGAELQRLLQQRRGEDIVHHDDRADLVGEVADRAHVHDLEHRLEGVSSSNQRGGLRQRGGHWPRSAPSTNSGRCRSAAAGWRRSSDRAKQRAGGDDAVAGPEMREQRGMHRRHAGGGDATGLGPFQRGDALFQHCHCRVCRSGNTGSASRCRRRWPRPGRRCRRRSRR